eukprot:m.211669 g.211669  ORF g.211669 m.211669 type:complete len:143 (+) comp15842_c0_seq3:1399-1827(+)
MEVGISEDLHRYLIGSRGVMIRSIQQDSGVRYFPTTRNTPPWAAPSRKDAISIVGPKEACLRAKKIIKLRVADYEMRAKASEEREGRQGDEARSESVTRRSMVALTLNWLRYLVISVLFADSGGRYERLVIRHRWCTGNYLK